MNLIRGTRVPTDKPIHEFEPGDYQWDGGPILWGMAPSGELCRVDERWKIVEHDDGTITVGPLEPGGAYSIQINKDDVTPGWHGYLERGVWRTC